MRDLPTITMIHEKPPTSGRETAAWHHLQALLGKEGQEALCAQEWQVRHLLDTLIGGPITLPELMEVDVMDAEQQEIFEIKMREI